MAEIILHDEEEFEVDEEGDSKRSFSSKSRNLLFEKWRSTCVCVCVVCVRVRVTDFVHSPHLKHSTVLFYPSWRNKCFLNIHMLCWPRNSLNTMFHSLRTRTVLIVRVNLT